MKIYTRRGDSGQTDLIGGPRVPKDHVRVEAYGTLDELSAALGVCAAATTSKDLAGHLATIQARLFDLGAWLATPDPERREKSRMTSPTAADVEALEGWIDGLEAELPPLRRFILPGGTAAAAAFHLARTVCRRAERRCVALDRDEPLGGEALRYLNRLSDLLFVMARVENRRAGVADVEWSARPKAAQ